jgi:hypothetical protein
MICLVPSSLVWLDLPVRHGFGLPQSKTLESSHLLFTRGTNNIRVRVVSATSCTSRSICRQNR